MWTLDQSARDALLELPESGMGFQIVEGLFGSRWRPLLILNTEHALDLSAAGLESGDDPAVILRNGLGVIEALRSSAAPAPLPGPGPHSFRLLSSRLAQTAGGPGVSTAPAASLVKQDVLGSPRLFYRFSAYNPDRRVDPATGSFVSGTYAAPASEVPFVPTGFVAVGRFALPNLLPASYRYEIQAPAGTTVRFGTVAPAHGQAGGGVEAYFANPVINARNPATPVNKLPDE